MSEQCQPILVSVAVDREAGRALLDDQQADAPVRPGPPVRTAVVTKSARTPQVMKVLVAVDDEVVAVAAAARSSGCAATSDPPSGSVIASEPISSPASVGRTNRSTRSGVPRAAMWGSAMPPVNSAAISPLDAPGLEASPRAARPSRAGRRPRRRPPRGTRRRAAPASPPRGAARAAPRRRPPTPGGAARPRADELGGHRAQRSRSSALTAALLGSPPCRDRAHSPSPLACGSKRVDAATPVAEQALDDHVDRAEVGQQVHLDVEVGGLRQQGADPDSG